MEKFRIDGKLNEKLYHVQNDNNKSNPILLSELVQKYEFYKSIDMGTYQK